MFNTCFLSATIDTINNNLIYYSHLVPIFFTTFLGLLVFSKAKRTVFSKIFLMFTLVFSLWLLGDLITWISGNYHLIYATWSLLDYIEIVFFVVGFYFATVFIQKKDVAFPSKILLFSTTLVPLAITISRRSVEGFYHPWCESFNNEFLGQYKLYLEILIVALVFLYMLLPFFRRKFLHNKKINFVVLGSMFLFLAVFSITEYLASVTGIYEWNLYALFVIPIFLVAITYSIFSLDIFDVKIVSTYFLVFGFLILTGLQYFFVTDTDYKSLTLVTLIISLSLSYILFKNLHKESEQREQLAKLNVDLQESIKQRESLVHLVTHKVKGSFTRTKFIFAGLLDGTFGKLTPEVEKVAKQGLDFDNGGLETVDLVLNVANLEKGLIKYDMKPVDFREILEKTLEEKKGPIEAKGLQLENEIKDGNYKVMGDAVWLKEVINNLLENSTKYTRQGAISVSLTDGNNKILLTVKDTGIGITPEDEKNLFTEGGRGKDSLKANVDSTGYGLYSVKLIVEAHKGKVWEHSEGQDKGSQFFVELPAI
ncbi:hypothetical protein HYW73_04110 [Candidatus Nomurabacteria bacterium]|nr:hypothetical protein [Candidatus Nomurabacteria bacterium]